MARRAWVVLALLACVSAPAEAQRRVVRPEGAPAGRPYSPGIQFGNTLYIRGAGGGLSWTVGVPMTCVAADVWRISLDAARQDIAFKVLVNDLSWSVGADYTAVAGSNVTVRPSF